MKFAKLRRDVFHCTQTQPDSGPTAAACPSTLRGASSGKPQSRGA